MAYCLRERCPRCSVSSSIRDGPDRCARIVSFRTRATLPATSSTQIEIRKARSAEGPAPGGNPYRKACGGAARCPTCRHSRARGIAAPRQNRKLAVAPSAATSIPGAHALLGIVKQLAAPRSDHSPRRSRDRPRSSGGRASSRLCKKPCSVSWRMPPRVHVLHCHERLLDAEPRRAASRQEYRPELAWPRAFDRKYEHHGGLAV